MVAYARGTADNAPKLLYVESSTDFTSWTPPVLVNALGDSSFPQIERGPTAGDGSPGLARRSNGRVQRVVSRSTDGGSNFGSAVRLSNLGSGAPYKSPTGHVFPDGDYFGLTVSSTGVAHIIWGEADGTSLYCCGDTWYTRGN